MAQGNDYYSTVRMPGGVHTAEVDFSEQQRIANSYPYRPGFGGVIQGTNLPGWHVLSHAGAIEGTPIVDYKLHKVVSTQAGAKTTAVNLYTTEYMSQ